jgi:hypothetical protein
MLQLSLARGQTLADFTKGMGSRQLAEHHGHELGPAAKTASVPLRFMVGDKVFKLRPGKQFQKLTKNAGESYQATPFRCVAFFSGNRY